MLSKFDGKQQKLNTTLKLPQDKCGFNGHFAISAAAI